MKKTVLFSIIVLTLLLTGCGENKLMCSYSSTNSYYGSDSIFVKYYFDKDGKIDNYVINEKMTYNDEYLKNNNKTMDSLYEDNKSYCDNIPKSDNIKCNFSRNGNTFKVIVKYNISKMSKEEIEKLQLADYMSLGKDGIKNQFKSQGFTCK